MAQWPFRKMEAQQQLYERYIGSIQRVFSVDFGGSIGGYIRVTKVAVSPEGQILVTGQRVHDCTQHSISCCKSGHLGIVNSIFKEYREELLAALKTTDASGLENPLGRLQESLLLLAPSQKQQQAPATILDNILMHRGTWPGAFAATSEAAATRHVCCLGLEPQARKAAAPARPGCRSGGGRGWGGGYSPARSAHSPALCL